MQEQGDTYNFQTLHVLNVRLVTSCCLILALLLCYHMVTLQRFIVLTKSPRIARKAIMMVLQSHLFLRIF